MTITEVWIATEGIYAEKEIVGVYLTLADSLAAYPDDTFTERPSGEWWNGRDHSECVSINRHPIRRN
jgi:hypothetical protein